MVGQHAKSGVQLENIEPAAAKPVETMVLFDSREGWINGNALPAVLHARLILRGGGKRHFYVAGADASGVVTQRGILRAPVAAMRKEPWLGRCMTAGSWSNPSLMISPNSVA